VSSTLSFSPERAMAVERHLGRLGERLPGGAGDFRHSTDAADAVILHLWQAVQIVIDLAVSSCLRFDLGAPQGYADAFRRLEAAGIVDPPLADRLVLATGFRNVVAHASEPIDMQCARGAALHNSPSRLGQTPGICSYCNA